MCVGVCDHVGLSFGIGACVSVREYTRVCVCVLTSLLECRVSVCFCVASIKMYMQ